MGNTSSSLRLGFIPVGGGYIPLAQEAQARPAQAADASSSNATPIPTAGAPGGSRQPVRMSHIQSELLRRFEEGEESSSRSRRQEGIQPLADTALSNEDQAVLNAFLQKADADPANTQSSKDYSKNLLEELAGWLKRQAYHPGIRSLQDLPCLADCKANFKEMEKNFIADGAAPLVPIGRSSSIFRAILKALNQSRDEPKIKLPISPISRQDEKLLHAFDTAFRTAQLSQGMPEHRVNSRLNSHIYAFKVLLGWLHKKPIFRQSYGLHSLEKLRDAPEGNLKAILNRMGIKMASQSLIDSRICHATEDSIKMVRKLGIDPHTAEKISIITLAVQALRELKPQIPSPAESRTMQPALRQQPPVQPAQSSDPSSPYYLSTLGFNSDDIDFIKQTFTGAFANQLDAAPAVEHASMASTSGTQPRGVRRPASPPQDEPSAVRRRLDNDPGSLQPEDRMPHPNR